MLVVWRFQFHIGTHQESIVRPPHGHDEPKLVIIVFQRMYVSAIQGRIPVCFRQYFRLTPVDETLRSTVKNGMPFGQRSLIVVRIVIFYSRQSLLHWYLRKTCPHGFHPYATSSLNPFHIHQSQVRYYWDSVIYLPARDCL
ncbi:hypothetical protein C801_00379 [Bacteroides uniformis dnLKV2]|uniref:Uncharacterized protein n=1 Tax=Bacteroides uniformis dnLKV2 TaxID=1235787 RepID=R9I2J5_BACUN|nr:hypothetical protein C801_00379 [Bacteroides uniformis dnLKV2]